MLPGSEMKHNRFFFSDSFLVLLALTIISVLFPEQSGAQDTNAVINVTDTVIQPKHSAKKASLYSMALPGLGQAYNRKYWKIPVIYAGFGVLGYNIHVNNKEMKEFTEA